jgi:hypothetical protein
MHIKICLFLTFIFNVGYTIQSQSYWSKTFSIGESNEESVQCYIWNGDIYVFGNASAIQGIRMDSDGKILDAIEFNDSGSTSLLYKPALSFHYDKLMVSGYIQFEGKSRPLLLEVDLPGLTTYTSHVLETVTSEIILPDGHQKFTDDQVLFYGDNTNFGKLLCTNLQGEALWDLSLGTNPSRFYTIVSPLSQFSDSLWIGILHERSLRAGITNNAELILYGIDSKGNKIFERKLGWPYVMRYNYPSVSQAHTINDSSFLFTLNTILGLEEPIGANTRVIGMDTNYQELWRLFNDDDDFKYDREITRIDRLRNQNYLGVGTKLLKGEEHWSGLRKVGWIFSFTPQGELLWERNYVVPGHYTRYMYNFSEDEDGSVVVVAGVWDSVFNQDNRRLLKNWVLRLDPNGCINPGCTDSLLILSNNKTISIYPNVSINTIPNPVIDFLQLSWDDLPSAKASLIAYDLGGKILGHWTIDTKSGMISLDVSSWPRGVIIFSFRGEQWMAMPQKVVLK